MSPVGIESRAGSAPVYYACRPILRTGVHRGAAERDVGKREMREEVENERKCPPGIDRYGIYIELSGPKMVHERSVCICLCVAR